MSHFPLERLAAALRGEGIEVDILPGAQGRSARMFASTGYKRGCQAIVEHHTGGSGAYPESEIQYILNGKGDGYVISNAYTWRTKKKITLIASGPTYTEGSGGPYGLIPENGANSIAFSNEIASPGGEQSIYPDFQQDAVAAFAYHAGKIAAETWGWLDDPFGKYRAFSHFEWAPGRKIDPRGVSRWSPLGGMWNMDMFRAELRSRIPTDPEDDMRILATPRRAYDSRKGGGPFAAGESRSVAVGMTTEAFVNVTAIGQSGTTGYFSVNDPGASTSIVNYSGDDRVEANSAPVLTPNGQIVITNHGGIAHVVVDVFAEKP